MSDDSRYTKESAIKVAELMASALLTLPPEELQHCLDGIGRGVGRPEWIGKPFEKFQIVPEKDK